MDSVDVHVHAAIPGGHEIHMLQPDRYINEITDFIHDL
jgi:hypothetical protein